jgi:hypothetical protein
VRGLVIYIVGSTRRIGLQSAGSMEGQRDGYPQLNSLIKACTLRGHDVSNIEDVSKQRCDPHIVSAPPRTTKLRCPQNPCSPIRMERARPWRSIRVLVMLTRLGVPWERVRGRKCVWVRTGSCGFSDSRCAQFVWRALFLACRDFFRSVQDYFLLFALNKGSRYYSILLDTN